MRRPLTIFVLLLSLAVPAAAERVSRAEVWPAADDAPLSQLGRGVALVFSPDLSSKGGCAFWEVLGFACFDDASWRVVIERIRLRNDTVSPDEAIRTVVVETHSANGNGLKLQEGKKADDARSYIAVGALQEQLEGSGVSAVIVSACNSRRLFRRTIYNTLDEKNGDKLFLPATLGIINASEGFDPRRSDVRVVTREESHLETVVAGEITELDDRVRRLLEREADRRKVRLPSEFTVSEMLVQLLTDDPALRLVGTRATNELSRKKSDALRNEEVFDRFAGLVREAASRRRLTDGI